MEFTVLRTLVCEAAGRTGLTFGLFERLWGELRTEPLYPGHRGSKTDADDSESTVCQSRAEARRRVKEVADRFASLPEPIPVWRMVLVGEGRALRLDQGESWGFSKSNVITFGMAHRKADALIGGKAPSGSVDWPETFKRLILYSYGGLSGDDESENEIVIPSSRVAGKTYQWVEPDEDGVGLRGTQPQRLVADIRMPDKVNCTVDIDEDD